MSRKFTFANELLKINKTYLTGLREFGKIFLRQAIKDKLIQPRSVTNYLTKILFGQEKTVKIIVNYLSNQVTTKSKVAAYKNIPNKQPGQEIPENQLIDIPVEMKPSKLTSIERAQTYFQKVQSQTFQQLNKVDKFPLKERSKEDQHFYDVRLKDHYIRFKVHVFTAVPKSRTIWNNIFDLKTNVRTNRIELGVLPYDMFRYYAKYSVIPNNGGLDFQNDEAHTQYYKVYHKNFKVEDKYYPLMKNYMDEKIELSLYEKFLLDIAFVTNKTEDLTVKQNNNDLLKRISGESQAYILFLIITNPEDKGPISNNDKKALNIKTGNYPVLYPVIEINKPDPQFNFDDFEIENNIDNDMIYHENIEYQRKAQPKTFEDLIVSVKSKEIKKACGYNIILNHTVQIEKYLNRDVKPTKYKYLTIPFIYEKIHKKPYEKDASLKLTIGQVAKFCTDYLRITFEVANLKNNVIKTYKPEKENTNLKIHKIRVLYDNHHVYLLNANLRQFDRLAEKLIELPKDKVETKELSNQFNIRKESDCKQYFIDCLDQLATCPFDEIEAEAIKAEKVPFVEVIYNKESLLEIFKYLFYTLNYHPKLHLASTGKILSITIKIGKTICTIKSWIDTDEIENHIMENEYEVTKDLFATYEKLNYQMYSSILNKENLSNYNDNLFNVFENYKYGGAFGRFNTIENDEELKSKEFVSIDVIKEYASHLLQMKKVPKFNQFDDFEKYDNHKIEEYTIYYVIFKNRRSICNNYLDLLLPNENNYVYGIILIEAEQFIKDKIEILAYCRPSITNDADKIHEAVRAVWSCKTLKKDMKKNIINKNIGQSNKLTGIVGKTTLLCNSDDAYLYQKQYNGSIYRFDGRDSMTQILDTNSHKIDYSADTNKMYYHVKERHIKYTSGFKPIGFLIYNMSRLKQFLRIKELQEQNIKVYGIKTDGLLILKDQCPEIESVDRNDINNFGKFHIETNKKLMNCKFIGGAKGPTIIISSENPYIRNFEYKDEYNPTIEERQKLIDTLLSKNLLIKAGKPGSGKTFETKKLIELLGKDNCITITPYNLQKLNYTTEDFNCKTHSSFYNKRFNADTNELVDSNMKKPEEKDYKYIIIEEIFALSVTQLAMIKDTMDKHLKDKAQLDNSGNIIRKSRKIFISNGDVNQLEPIEDVAKLNNIKDLNKYRTNIINKMFSVHLTLNVNKRHQDKDHEKLDKIKDELFNQKVTPIEIIKKYFKPTNKPTGFNVCYYNKTVDKINRLVHTQEYKPKSKGVIINDIYYEKGMYIVSSGHLKIGKDKICTNYFYTIVDINAKNITIKQIDDDKTFKLDYTQIKNHFTLSYANTCHSVQALTIEKSKENKLNPFNSEEVTIHDIYSPFITNKWLWTALTRNRDLDKVYYFHEELTIEDKQEILSEINKKINSYKLQDNNAEREFDDKLYCNANWVFTQAKNQNYHCYHCQEHFSLKLDKKAKLTNYTIDRLDNSMAHIKSNCVLAHLSCNIKAYDKTGKTKNIKN